MFRHFSVIGFYRSNRLAVSQIHNQIVQGTGDTAPINDALGKGTLFVRTLVAQGKHLILTGSE